ncbi:hypothetical protein RAS12_30410 (plasmid) [Achromobacter seleniivolatilans]|uniref:Outer membrane lipoprotein BfpB n=1 Tax=Achromobacter seleniivolatilans TaxID=3047478 RepID=A0ABY9MAD4_9BURK|nr:hypothetical protein [Achromobacter sp. R39]WMD23948.1 hypothetical protein RAS12_30410 [Achromobacter sp. R39]
MKMNDKRFVLRTVGLVVALAALSGCSAIQKSDQVLDASRRARDDVASKIGDYKSRITDRDRRMQANQVDKPWIVGKSVPLGREVTLPAALRRDVNTALMFKGGPTSLQTIAERIQLATGINTRVTPDALMAQEAFAPRLESEKSENLTPLVAMPSVAQLPDGVRPLAEALDAVANRLAVHWKYDDKTAAIVFYRVETKAFNVRALLTTATVNAGIGLDGKSGGSGGADGKSGSDFDSTSKTEFKGDEKVNPIEAVMSKVKPFLSKAGSIVAQPSGTNSIVVTDTVEVLRNIDEFLERENRMLTRRVRLVFEEVVVSMNDQHDGRIDWKLVYATASAAAAGAAPTGAVGAAAGTVASGTVGSGPFKGSDAIIQALDEIGATTRSTAIPLSALNRRPITYADRKTFSYINEVQTTGLSSSDSSSGSFSTVPNVSVRQKDVTVGQFLTIVPDAQDDGQILLTISYDSTINDPLQTIKFGDAKNGIEIQQLTVRGNGMVQQVALQSGQPLVIAGFQKDQDQTSRQRFDEKAPILFGGSNTTNNQKLYNLIIVTAQVEEGL